MMLSVIASVFHWWKDSYRFLTRNYWQACAHTLAITMFLCWSNNPVKTSQIKQTSTLFLLSSLLSLVESGEVGDRHIPFCSLLSLTTVLQETNMPNHFIGCHKNDVMLDLKDRVWMEAPSNAYNVYVLQPHETLSHIHPFSLPLSYTHTHTLSLSLTFSHKHTKRGK